MINIERLYRSAPSFDTPVCNLVRDIEKYAKEKGYKFSRWETHSKACGWYTTVTYAFHKGDRPARSDLLPQDALVMTLTQVEGKTRRCTAYRELSDFALTFIEHIVKEK